MLSKRNLYDLAKCRFEEATILLQNDKPDGAVYLCGYAIELMLKRKIVEQLDWNGYPEGGEDFKNKTSFKTHNLEVLLHFSGLEKQLKSDTTLFAKWNVASAWDSEIRYKTVGTITSAGAADIISASRDILNFILRNT